jgi:hypothetical protein
LSVALVTALLVSSLVLLPSLSGLSWRRRRGTGSEAETVA